MAFIVVYYCIRSFILNEAKDKEEEIAAKVLVESSIEKFKIVSSAEEKIQLERFKTMFAFDAGVQLPLSLNINSIYSFTEIFIREFILNASGILEKI